MSKKDEAKTPKDAAATAGGRENSWGASGAARVGSGGGAPRRGARSIFAASGSGAPAAWSWMTIVFPQRQGTR